MRTQTYVWRRVLRPETDAGLSTNARTFAAGGISTSLSLANECNAEWQLCGHRWRLDQCGIKLLQTFKLKATENAKKRLPRVNCDVLAFALIVNGTLPPPKINVTVGPRKTSPVAIQKNLCTLTHCYI